MTVDPLQAAIFPIVRMSKADGEFCAVGSAFSISSGGRDALLVSAAHVFDDVRKKDEGRERHHPSALFVPEQKPHRLKRTLVFAMVVPTGRAHFFARIDDVMICPGNDLALAIAVLGAEVPDHVRFASGLTIDSAVPAKGSEIMLTGYGNPTWKTVRSDTRSQTRFDQFFVRMKDGANRQPANVPFDELLRRGIVRDVSWLGIR